MNNQTILEKIERAAKNGDQILDLSNNALTALPPEIGQLTSLTTLTLTNNALTALPPEIGQLTSLTTLTLTNNALTTLPPEIGQLTSLIILELTDNILIELPSEIGQLANLTTLDLMNNRLRSLPPEIGRLTRLTILAIPYNNLMTLPPEVGRLISLRGLDLMNNLLTSLPSEIGHLTNLTILTLTKNVLMILPSEIGRLTSLTALNLSGNNLQTLPPEIGRLTRLTILDLRHNDLMALPPEVGRLMNLTTLKLGENNVLASPPPAVVGQGTKAILEYLRGLLQASSRQWVSKMLVVGQGGVGKTSLLRALRVEEFNIQQETTHGIEIKVLELPHPVESDITMQLNTWDFAGQEIAHATHQFFLTNRSLFILAWNARHGFEQGRLYYWLDTIKALAPQSPILLVATWADERDPDLPLADLRRSYPQIIDHYAISSKTGVGVEALRQAITEVAADLPLMGEQWPTAWLDAADAVRAMTEKHLSMRELERRFTKYGVAGNDAKVLTQWLHELGEILHFRDNEELNDTVILEPQWVTEYIARVLASEDVIRESGIFTRAEMETLWADLELTMQERFLRLMEQFDLSYRTEENREISLVVERLSLDEADYHSKWKAIQNTELCRELSMKFELGTIPAGVPTWFIARQHRFTTHTHWRNGVLFADEAGAHLALVRALPHDRHMWLTVRGPHPQNFFALLKDGIEVTLDRFPGLQITRKVPCPCDSGMLCKHEFDYEDLLKRIYIKPTIECPKSTQDVVVAKMLYGVEWTRDDIITSALEDIKKTVVAGDQEIVERIGDQAALVQREFLKQFMREQSFLESDCPNVFILRAQGASHWKEMFVGGEFELQLLCQYPGDWHPVGEKGIYTINDPAEWLHIMAPYIIRLTKVLKAVAPFASPLLGMSFSAQEASAFANNLKLMEELVKNLPDIKTKDPEADYAHRLEIRNDSQRAEGASLRALRQLLELKDPNRVWGNLEKILTPEDHYLWLCPYHKQQIKR